MPHPAILDRDEVIIVAHHMIESDGLQAFSLGKLAAHFDVKTPSLYRHFRNRDDLLREVNNHTSRALLAILHSTANSPEAADKRLLAVAHAYRDFVQTNPVTYTLAYGNIRDEVRPDPDELAAGAIVLQAIVAEISGEADSLLAIRSFWAMLHGFAVLEISGQFRRGGDLDAAFESSIYALIRGWQTA